MKNKQGRIGIGVCTLGAVFNLFAQDFLGICLFALLGIVIYISNLKTA